MSDEDAGTEVARGALDRVVEAFMALGKNRLPLSTTQRIHAAKKVAIEAVGEREELRKALVEQYKPEGAGDNWQGFADVDDAPDELLDKIGELVGETVALEIGEPVNLNGTADSIQIEEAHYSVLAELGFFATEDNDE